MPESDKISIDLFITRHDKKKAIFIANNLISIPMKKCKDALTENDIIDLIVAMEMLIESTQNELDYIQEFGYDNEEWSKNFQADITEGNKILKRIERKRK